MKSVLILVVLASFCVVCTAQSGRVRTEPTPTPTPVRGRVYVPTEIPQATPTPTPKPVDANDDETIRVTSSLVPIPVFITDKAGRSITNLKAADLDLRIDGKAASIGELVRSDAQISLAMIFDNSSSVTLARDFEKAAAIRFFRRVLRAGRDQAALFSLAEATRLEQPLTRDIDSIARAIEFFPPPKGATALLDGLIEAANYLRDAPGRRVLVLVSDGEDTYSDLKTTLEDSIRALQLADVQVFIVNTKIFENYTRTGVRGGNANIRSLTAERRMSEITAQTGGEVFGPVDEKEMDAAFSRISADLADQYTVYFYPEPEAETPGQMRTITVTVKGRPDLAVRARKSYYVPKRGSRL
ncbi:MAG: von Willebrand factor A [Acidobacteria bacterium OLB17]|nr:MAG: von Willebrand factor A [Acidobacteria bacterium OLB17]MCZ2390998.1 VWA domain-containing protein [Acidobacteriota bacterium]